MTDKDAKKFCRYYHGENECPFRYDDERATLWRIERMWVERMVADDTNHIEEAIGEYVGYGLGEFRMRDNVPLSLKALLFNRFCKYNERVDVAGFKVFYQKYYK